VAVFRLLWRTLYTLAIIFIIVTVFLVKSFHIRSHWTQKYSLQSTPVSNVALFPRKVLLINFYSMPCQDSETDLAIENFLKYFAASSSDVAPLKLYWGKMGLGFLEILTLKCYFTKRKDQINSKGSTTLKYTSTSILYHLAFY